MNAPKGDKMKEIQQDASLLKKLMKLIIGGERNNGKEPIEINKKKFRVVKVSTTPAKKDMPA